MGSSTSKPRKKGNHSHLPKVGTPSNQAYEEKVRRSYLGGPWMWIVGVVFFIAVVSFLIILVVL